MNPTIVPTHKNEVINRIRYILCLYNYIKMESTVMCNEKGRTKIIQKILLDMYFEEIYLRVFFSISLYIYRKIFLLLERYGFSINSILGF